MLKHLAIFAVLLVAQHPIPANGSEQQQQPQTKPSAPQPAAPAPHPDDAQKGADGKKDAHQQSKAKKYLEDAFAPANLSNWILAGLGVIGGVMAGITLRVIVKQASHMERQTKILEESVAAAQKSADAALAQVETGKNAQRAQLRIEFANLDPTWDEELGGFPVHFRVIVDGTTRAYIIEDVIAAEIPDYPRKKRTWWKPMGIPKNISPEMSPIQGATVLQRTEYPMGPETDQAKVDLLTQNMTNVVLEGSILYRDVFGDRWRLKFHRVWRYHSLWGGEDAIGGDWSYLGDNDNGEEKVDRVSANQSANVPPPKPN